MEKLQKMLFEAATQGSVSSLQQLLKDDPLILDRVVVNSFSETPLHVAAMLGHIDFVKKIIGIKPQLVKELNLQQSSPLHLASAKGHIDVMKALLSVDQEACFVRDRNSLTPVHLAAVKGRVEAMKVLLRAQPDAAQLTVYGGENILHLCVKHYQLEALKLLLKKSSVGEIPEFINSKNVDGNTVLHLAVADKQVEATNFLVSVGAVQVNAVNNDGMTAMDVLIRSRKDMRDSEIEKSLKHGGGFGSSDTTTMHNAAAANMNQNKKSKNGEHKDWLEKQKTALMIVATLIATMAFQIGVNPPSGVWQDDSSSDDPHEAGYSILAHKNPTGFGRFYITNATSFMASLSIILLLISGLPLRRRLFMWILMVTTWIAITAIALCYLFAMIILTPNYSNTILYVIGWTVIVWILLMALLIISHAIRLIVKIFKKLRKRNYAVSALEGNNIQAV